MIKFVETFHGNAKLSTFFESCGVADLITTCYGGRNRRVCEQFIKTGKSIKELEDELLGGQKLQGPATADEVNAMLKAKGLTDKFPLFTAVHRICTRELKGTDLIDQIRNHPEHALVYYTLFYYFKTCMKLVRLVHYNLILSLIVSSQGETVQNISQKESSTLI